MFKKNTFEANPIIIKELRSRMRGPRPFITLTVMLILLSGLTYGVYRVAVTYFDYYTGAPLSPQIGQMLFTMLIYLLLLSILIITPAVTSNAVSREKENLTYEILMTTPLHPAKILWGKLFSALSYVFLLIFAAIPIASLIFVFGGVTLRDMVKSAIILTLIAITIGVFGLFMSTLLKRSTSATVISYVLIAVFIIGSIVIYGAVGVLTRAEPPRWILALNPVSVLASGISNLSLSNFNTGLLPVLAADLGAIDGSTFGIDYIPRPLYHYSLPLYGLLSLVFYALATRLVLPTRRWRITRKDVLIFLGTLLALIVVVIFGLFMTIDQYERAVVPDAPIINNLIGPMARPLIPPDIAPAIEFAQSEEVAVPAPEVSILELSDDELPMIYSQAINEVVFFLQNSTIQFPSTFFLIKTLISSSDDQSNYLLTEDAQDEITAALSEYDLNYIWFERLADTDKLSQDGIKIVFSTMSINIDGTAKSTIWGYQQDNLLFQYNYSITSEDGIIQISESDFSY